MSISIIIPAYNEEERIEESLNKILVYLKKNKTKYEIIVVDDGSTDNTAKLVKKFKPSVKVLRNNVNSGKGYSVKKGIENAKYEFILFTDADLATPINELGAMLKVLKKGYDVVIASRNLPESRILTRQPIHRQLSGKTFSLLVRMLLLPGIKDTQCGFKLFRAAAARRISKIQTIFRFCFDVEMLYIAKKLGFKIKEVPVAWVDKKGSRVSLFKDSFSMFIDLIKIKYNGLTGRYKE